MHSCARKEYTSLSVIHDLHSLVNECSKSVVVGEGDKVQFGESPRSFHRPNGIRVLLIPPRGVDVVVIGQIVYVFNQTTTKAHLQIIISICNTIVGTISSPNAFTFKFVHLSIKGSYLN